MKTVILSLGGSMIVPKDVDYYYLREFKNFIIRLLDEGYKFVIVCGGGKTSSNYMYAANRVSENNNEDLDWIGVQSSRLNAELVRVIFGPLAYEKVVIDPTQKITTKKPIIVGAGWKPGWSTDYVAVKLAEKLKADELVNLTNIDYVYTKDPNKFPDAKKVYETTWAKYRKMISSKWSPRLSTPFDPIASELAQKIKLKVALINGKYLTHVSSYLKGETFDGTLIK